MSKTLAAGQWLRHERFGVGVAVESDEEHTTIDFEEHGPKKFVTRLLEVELTSARDTPLARRRRKTTVAR
ncbi:MAG: hypothetical protein DMF78_17910 [Acidobacteria bacterium]|nr:MAG: hypothetical protein DMF78_17910 [Acidobacteriota bacterium]